MRSKRFAARLVSCRRCGLGSSPDCISAALNAIDCASEVAWLTIVKSRVKKAIKRQHPGFNERAYGFRTFSDLLLEAQKRGLLKLESDKSAGGYFLHPAE